jgi:hypothetical protein
MRRHAVGLIITLALGLLMVPLAADTQQPAKGPRIGFLSPRSRTDLALSLEAFQQGLRELGYVEGQKSLLSTALETIGLSGCLRSPPSSCA